MQGDKPKRETVCSVWAGGWGRVDLALTKDEMGSRAQQWVGGPWDKALVPSDSNSSVSCLPLHCDLWLGIKALLMEFCHVSVPYKGRCPPGATGGLAPGDETLQKTCPQGGNRGPQPHTGQPTPVLPSQLVANSCANLFTFLPCLLLLANTFVVLSSGWSRSEHSVLAGCLFLERVQKVLPMLPRVQSM